MLTNSSARAAVSTIGNTSAAAPTPNGFVTRVSSIRPGRDRTPLPRGQPTVREQEQHEGGGRADTDHPDERTDPRGSGDGCAIPPFSQRGVGDRDAHTADREGKRGQAEQPADRVAGNP